MRVTFELDKALEDQLDRIEGLLDRMVFKENQMSDDLTALTTEVARQTTVDSSIQALVVKLAADIAANINNPAALQTLVDQMRANNDAIAAAVTANTPAPPAPVPAA